MRSKAFSQSPIIKLRRLKMIDDAAVKASAGKGTYEARPWLKHYASYVKPEITPGFASALEMFLQTVQALPEQPAIYYFDRAISYGELDRQSTALAAALQERGVVHGDRVALYLQNIPQFLIAMYAAWKAGAIVVLCNPMFKQRELEYHLNDSGSKGLICLESLYDSVACGTVGNTKVEFVITTSELDYLGAEPVPALLVSSRKQRFAETLDMLDLVRQHAGATLEFARLTPGDIAFLTYTSGTTGQPKGAMNTHANLVFIPPGYRARMQLATNAVVVRTAPSCHTPRLLPLLH